MSRHLLAGSAVVLALCLSFPAMAYDPMRAMRNGQQVSGLAYSPFDPLTSHGSLASPDAILDEEEPEIGISAVNFAAYLRYQKIDDIQDDIDVLIDEANDIQASYDEARRLQRDVDAIVRQLQDKGNVVNGMFGVSSLPTITWSDPRLGGSLFFDHHSNASLGADIPYAFGANINGASVSLNRFCGTDTNNDGIPEDFDRDRCALESDATINLLAVTDFSSYSLGYSRHVLDYKHDNPYKSGKLVVGGQVSFFSLTTAVSVLRIEEQSNNDALEDVLEDLNENTNSNSGFDLGLGVHWVSSRYMAGASVANLFAPNIEYANGETIEPGVPVSVHGSWLFVPDSDRWGVRFHNDLSGQKDPVGTELQWRTLSIGYASESWWIPGFEIGKRWNLGEGGTSYTSGGVKLFQLLRLQVAVSDDSVDGVPRALLASASLGAKF